MNKVIANYVAQARKQLRIARVLDKNGFTVTASLSREFAKINMSKARICKGPKVGKTLKFDIAGMAVSRNAI